MKSLQEYLNEIEVKRFIIGAGHAWVGNKNFVVDDIDATEEYKRGFEDGFVSGERCLKSSQGMRLYERVRQSSLDCFGDFIISAQKSRKIWNLRESVREAVFCKGCVDGMEAAKNEYDMYAVLSC